MTIGSGADQINLYYFGPAHTGGDAFVEFPAHRVMHVGDTFPNKGLPIMDKINGGSGVQYANTIRKAVEGVKNVDTIINGHTPAQTTPADMREFARLRQRLRRLRAGGEEGRQDRRARPPQSGRTPAKYKGYSTPNAQAATAYAQVIMDETK